MKYGLAGYTLTDTVRETQSASLLRGTRDADNARVVVKLLRADHPTGAQLARLRHEHALLSSLDLPVVVRTLGLVKHGRGEALVLEDLGDRSVESLFRDRRPSLTEFLDIAIEMAGALAALHSRAIIHKDIKPHHFLLHEGALKIIDLGIATRLSTETQAATSATLLEGTLAYMSPEQTGRMNRSLDRRTDLYSLGAALYHLLTGRLPFEASDPLELVHAHIARAPRPAHELVPEVPHLVSDILTKLLAKAAEDRYQSATGLKADLEACRAQLATEGNVTPFPLGRHDGSGDLSIPQKLYGRAPELEIVRAAFDSATRGGCRLLLVSGYSGIGKSALVNELRKHLGKGGTFVAGTFDQVNRAVPFAAVAAASRALVRSVLAEPPHVLNQYTSRLREAVGRNGKLIAELVPEIELVIGPQPAAIPLGPAESQARFELVFRQFLQVFADEEHPLALFLDDLQWADAASLRLLRQLLTGGQCQHVLIIGAFRSNETNELHPLLLTIEELRKAAVPIDEIALKPLGADAVTTLLAETLRLEAAAVAPLAATLVRKTNGNPFFIQQFLAALAEQQLLRFDPTARKWTWEDARIDAAVAADNVVDLLVARVRRLPVSARRVLTLAACVGQEFDLGTLALIWQGPVADLTTGLWETLREGLLIPLDASYRYLAESAKASNDLGEAIHSRYRFLHDRVQQHAYELVESDERSEIHLRIGRLLLGGSSEPSDDSLFEIVRQMNLAEALITGEAERRDLARFNLRAGLRMTSSGAHAAALTLIGRCLGLLGPNAWEVEHETTHRAHLAMAECEFVSGNVAGAVKALDTVEARSRTVLERVAGREIRIVMLASSVSGILDAVACGLETARMLGAEFPTDDAAIGPAIGAELGALRALLAERTIESLLDLPTMADPEKRALVDVLFKTNAPAFMSKPQVSVLIGLKAVRLAIEHGNAPMSPYFYDNYGIINFATGGELDVSFRFGQLGIDLLKKPGYAEIEASTNFLFGAFNSHWRRPISVSQEHLRHSVKAGLESGAYLHVAWAACVGMYYRLYRGESIPEILADVPQTMSLLRRSGNPVAQTLLKILEQTLKAFSGATGGPTSMDGDGFDEAGLLESAKKIRVLWVYYHVLKIPLVFHAGDFKRTLELAEAALPLMPGMFFITEHALYRSLARAALAADETGEPREAALATLRQEEETFRKWAEASPANHAHRLAIVSAEIAGLAGDAEQAMDLYDRAIRLAREGGFAYHEAEANELAARYHLRKHRTAIARAYLHEAWYGYQQWGAKAKTRQLLESHPALLGGIEQAAARPGIVATDGTTHSSTTDAARGLDLVTAVRATQALAGELELGKLLERLMRVIVENAGAQRGILILNHGGRLEVEALVTVEEKEVKLGLREPIERSTELAASVVQYVSRSKEALVLPDAAADPRFARDPYVVRKRPRSLLCLAMQHQGRLVGVLYLENNAATNAFSVDRVDLLQFVAAQAAVAVENATLYGELRAATDQLQQANDTLELQVAERTEELRRTLAELWSEMDLARKIQTVLLPSETRFRDYDVSAMMVPASTVGGDYYDIISADGSDWVLIGDVSGHGVTAGLTMMMVQTAIRTVVLGGGAGARQLTPAQVLSKVNSAVRSNLRKVDEDHYMTITGLQLEGSSVRYSGLHQDILVYRAAARAVERVETRGMWIGPVDDIAPLLSDDTLELGRGDIVLLFTDGITEAMIGGRRLGTDGLAAVFRKLAEDGSDNGGILRGIMQTMEGAPQDDVTMMAVRYLPQEAA